MVAGAIPLQRGDDARRVLGVGDVQNEDEVGLREIAFGRGPLRIAERQGAAMGGDAQSQTVLTVDLALGAAQRR